MPFIETPDIGADLANRAAQHSRLPEQVATPASTRPARSVETRKELRRIEISVRAATFEQI